MALQDSERLTSHTIALILDLKYPGYKFETYQRPFTPETSFRDTLIVKFRSEHLYGSVFIDLEIYDFRYGGVAEMEKAVLNDIVKKIDNKYPQINL